MVARLVPQLIKFGKIIRPGLGVSLVHDEVAQRWGIKGAVLARVDRGGAAGKVGLRGIRETGAGRIELGDVVTKMDGKPVESVDDLTRLLDGHKVGDDVTLEYVRNRKATTVTVTLQELK